MLCRRSLTVKFFATFIDDEDGEEGVKKKRSSVWRASSDIPAPDVFFWGDINTICVSRPQGSSVVSCSILSSSFLCSFSLLLLLLFAGCVKVPRAEVMKVKGGGVVVIIISVPPM